MDLGSAPVTPHPSVPLGAAMSMQGLLVLKMSTMFAPLPMTAIVPGWAASGFSQATAAGTGNERLRQQGN